jgi:hypothetical protein
MQQFDRGNPGPVEVDKKNKYLRCLGKFVMVFTIIALAILAVVFFYEALRFGLELVEEFFAKLKHNSLGWMRRLEFNTPLLVLGVIVISLWGLKRIMRK